VYPNSASVATSALTALVAEAGSIIAELGDNLARWRILAGGPVPGEISARDIYAALEPARRAVLALRALRQPADTSAHVTTGIPARVVAVPVPAKDQRGRNTTAQAKRMFRPTLYQGPPARVQARAILRERGSA